MRNPETIKGWCVDCGKQYALNGHTESMRARCAKCQAKYTEKMNRLSYQRRHPEYAHLFRDSYAACRYDPILSGRTAM